MLCLSIRHHISMSGMEITGLISVMFPGLRGLKGKLDHLGRRGQLDRQDWMGSTVLRDHQVQTEMTD